MANDANACWLFSMFGRGQKQGSGEFTAVHGKERHCCWITLTHCVLLALGVLKLIRNCIFFFLFVCLFFTMFKKSSHPLITAGNNKARTVLGQSRQLEVKWREREKISVAVRLTCSGMKGRWE